jgi:predicted metalloenzyme YecM
VSVAAALLLLLPTGEQAKAKNPTVTTASNRIEAKSTPTGGGSAELTKWEYATIPLPLNATKQTLDTYGDDGWDLVQVVPNHPGPNNDQLVAYMKRPKFG